MEELEKNKLKINGILNNISLELVHCTLYSIMSHTYLAKCKCGTCIAWIIAIPVNRTY